MNAVAWCVVILISAGLIVKCSESAERDKQAKAMREGHFPTRRLPEPVFIPVPVRQPVYMPQMQQMRQQVLIVCPSCRGSGQQGQGTYYAKQCEYCNGQGTVVAGQGPRNDF
jgi:hypothetical protein